MIAENEDVEINLVKKATQITSQSYSLGIVGETGETILYPLDLLTRNNIGNFKTTDPAPAQPPLLNQNYKLIGAAMGQTPSGSYPGLLMAANTPLVIPTAATGHAIVDARAVWKGVFYEPQWQDVVIADLNTYAPGGNLFGVSVPTIQFGQTVDDTEISGNTSSRAVPLSSYGFVDYAKMPNDAIFNAIQTCVCAVDATSPVTVRVYKSPASNDINFFNKTLLKEVIFDPGKFPTDLNSIKTIPFGESLRASKDEYVYVAFFSTGLMNFKFWNTQGARTNFIWKSDTANPWGAVWLTASAGFYQAGFRLANIDSNITAIQEAVAANTKAISNAMVADPITGFVAGGAAVPIVQWTHVRGDSEMTGLNQFWNQQGVGQYEKLTNAALFNKIVVPFKGTASTQVTVKVYSSSGASSLKTNPASMTLLASLDYTAGAFNQTAAPAEIYLPTPVKVASGDYLYVFAFANVGGNVTVNAFTNDAPAAPLRHSFFYLASATPWTLSWTASFVTAGYYASTFKLSLVDVDIANKIATLAAAVAAIPTATLNVNIILPSKHYATVGFSRTLYFENILYTVENGSDGQSRYQVVVDCAVGTGYTNFWKITPTAANVGSYAFTVIVYDASKNIIAQKTSTLIVTAAIQVGSTKNVLFVGDSLTEPGATAKAIYDGFVTLGGTIPTFNGLRSAAPAKTEGRSGWTSANFTTKGPGVDGSFYRFELSGVVVAPPQFSSYTNNGSTYQVYEVNITGGSGYINCVRSAGSSNPTASGTLTQTVVNGGDATLNYSAYSISDGNPFWDGSAVNFTYYRTTKLGLAAGVKFDLVSVMLGINDIGQQPTNVLSDATITGFVNNQKTLANAILADNAACKVVIQLEPSCNNTGGGFTKSSSFPLYMQNMFKLWNALVLAFDNGAFNANVSIGCANAGIHRFYGYAQADVVFSSRYAGITEKYNGNNVHPQTSGYQEMGDNIFPQIHNQLL